MQRQDPLRSERRWFRGASVPIDPVGSLSMARSRNRLETTLQRCGKPPRVSTWVERPRQWPPSGGDALRQARVLPMPRAQKGWWSSRGNMEPETPEQPSQRPGNAKRRQPLAQPSAPYAKLTVRAADYSTTPRKSHKIPIARLWPIRAPRLRAASRRSPMAQCASALLPGASPLRCPCHHGRGLGVRVNSDPLAKARTELAVRLL